METVSLNSWLLTKLKCTICGEYMMDHIFQCNEGHNICDNCRSAVVRCLCCEAPFKDSRNHFLESIADYIAFPCLYYKDGCSQMLSKPNVSLHQKNCFHGPNRCPVLSSESCPWKGTTKETEAHLLQKHNFLHADIIGGFTTQCINVEDEHQWQLQFSIGNESFLRIFMINGGEFYGYVKYLGPDKKAELFRYKMQLNYKGIKIVFKGPVHPCKMSEENILKGGLCFRISHHALIDLLQYVHELCIETSIHA